ncbi:MAG: hypothetical protein VB087_01795 [Candidatus Limiplasma sp.]|nr:hypothetical protein [Candidatus Limiplasma sp.]MEA5146272.1 hypothetical protein [Candidatus Limiplasma sp.]
MKQYILTAGWKPAAGNAFQKARSDVEQLALKQGLEAFAMHAPQTAGGNRLRQLWLMAACLLDWLRLWARVEKGAMVFCQYPMYPVKAGGLIRRMIRWIAGSKHIAFVALVHDLDSLRGIDGKGALANDQHLLPVFDLILCHNARMKAHLCAQGIAAEKLIELGLFDYVTSVPRTQVTCSASLNIAGNLSPEKCGYLYPLLDKPPCMMHLYGKGLVAGVEHAQVVYHGMVPAEELPAQLQGAFGLVWDGDSAETCAGEFGLYLRYNNPHKASLYLAAGIPLIVWEDSALADQVRQGGYGLCIGSLLTLREVLEAVTPAQYAAMAGKARNIGEELREGRHFGQAYAEALRRTMQSRATA